MSKKKIIIIILLVFGIGGFFWYRSKTNVEVVPTETVRWGDVIETVSVSGELKPIQYADLSLKSSGVIDEVFVKEGDMVQMGDPLLSIDRTVLQAQLNAARLAVRIAEANERLARRPSSNSKKETIAAKKLTSEQAREDVQALLTQVKEGILNSPLDGRVVSLDARVGEVATAGAKLARVSQPDDFVIESRVPESDIAKVAIGMGADITFDAFSADEHFTATVIDIDSASTVVQDVVSYLVKFKLSDIDARLREGMTANIDIETAKRDNVLTVPFRALSKEAGKNYAEVKRSENQFERVEVKTGLEGDEGVIEILSGLSEGDEVTIGAKQKK